MKKRKEMPRAIEVKFNHVKIVVQIGLAMMDLDAQYKDKPDDIKRR